MIKKLCVGIRKICEWVKNNLLFTNNHSIGIDRSQFEDEVNINKENKPRYNKYFGGSKFYKSHVTIITTPFIVVFLFLCTIIICVAANNDSNRESKGNDDSSQIDENSSAESLDLSPDSSPDSVTFPPGEGTEFERYTNHYKLLENEIDYLFTNSVYSDNDIVNEVYERLNHYYTEEFYMSEKSNIEKTELNNLVYKDSSIAPLYQDILELNEKFHAADYSITCMDVGNYTTAESYYNRIIDIEPIPYIVHIFAITRSDYSTLLIRDYMKENSLSFSFEEIKGICKDAIYTYVYDMSFGDYRFDDCNFVHDIDKSYYNLGINYANLSLLSYDEIEKVKYLCYAIYYFEISGIEECNYFTPSYMIASCYYDLSKATYCKKYKSQYENKAREKLDVFLDYEGVISTNMDKAKDLELKLQ